jgi:citrate synthase
LHPTEYDEEPTMSEPPAVLRWKDTEVELPVVRGTEDELAVDISKLRAQTGLITLDYGYVNTGATESAITFIDGDAGILRYRGYDIADLADQPHPSFLETAWLLIYGELPTMDERDWFSRQIRKHTLLHEDVKRFYDGFPKDAHPMATLSAVVSALSTFYQHSDELHDHDEVQLSIIRLMAKLPTIAAYSYKKSIGQPFLYPDNSLDLIENFLRMMFAVPSEPYEVSETVVHALKQLLILHADHEQNCSTSTVRLVGSSDANLYASIAAGINALWGPLHGGANQAVVEMLEAIRDSDGDINQFVERAKDPKDDFRLSGFGHRVYKNYDPRATIIKAAAENVLQELGTRDDLFDIALELEHIALTDDFFIERRLYPNVDFYSGLIYRAMGFPTGMFPVLFAIGRLPGWIAHWLEGHENPKTKIGRPRQIYTGPTTRKYVPIEQR